MTEFTTHSPAAPHSRHPLSHLLCQTEITIVATIQGSLPVAMATFPFDPTPFLPRSCHAIEVEGRPARARVIHDDLRPTNEDLAIVTLVLMLQGELAFPNVREIVGEYLTRVKGLGF